MTADQKSELYSARLSNQSGNYSKGEIETAYVTGYNDAEDEAIRAFDMYLRNYQQLVQVNAEKTAIQWRYVGVSGSDLEPTEWKTLIEISRLKGDPGETPEFRQGGAGLEWKYQSEGADAWRMLVSIDVLKLKFSDLTNENIADFWHGVPADVMAEFQKPAIEAAQAIEQVKKETIEVKNATEKVCADTLVVKDATEKVRVQTNTVKEETEEVKADTLAVKESTDTVRRETIAIKEATELVKQQSNTVKEETEQVKSDTLAVKEAADKVRVDTLAVKDATEQVKSDTLKVKEKTEELNAHPMKVIGGIWFQWSIEKHDYETTGIQAKGDVGSSFKIVGRYDTLDELKEVVPDGTNVDGVYAVGAVEPFDYYAWLVVGGTWQWDNQGKLRGAEGKSSYEVWTEYPENEGKTKEDYFNWLSPVIDPKTGRWIIQGEDQGVQALGIDAEVTEKENTEDSYILHVKSAKGEFDTPNIRGISVKVTEKENTPDTYILTFKHAKGEFTTPNLRGFDVKVEELETNTPGDYKLKITTVDGEFVTPNLQGRSGSAVIDIDHEPTQADTHYTYNGAQYAFSVGDEVRWYDKDNEEYVLFKLYAVTQSGAVWEEMGSGGAPEMNIYLQGANYYNDTVQVITQGNLIPRKEDK